jgi:hypothetical protein
MPSRTLLVVNALRKMTNCSERVSGRDGQQELLNWVCLAGAMTELGRRPVWTDLAETYVYAAPKAFAVFEAG